MQNQGSFGDSFDNMKAFARAHRMDFPYLFDESQEAARAWRSAGGRFTASTMWPAAYSSGVRTSTAMSGSSRTGLALRAASLNAIEPAILNAISEESTS